LRYHSTCNLTNACFRLEIAAISAEERGAMRRMGIGMGTRAGAALAFALALMVPAQAQFVANQPSLLAPPRPPADIPTGSTSPGLNVAPPSGGVPAPPVQIAPMPPPPPAATQSTPMVPAGHVALAVNARYSRDAPPINAGLYWRVYADKPDASGLFRLVKEDRTPTPTFVLPPGGYVVHVTFGLASAVKSVTLRSETVREMFEIPAGGIRLEGRVGDVRIPAGQISFDVYKGSQFEPGEKRPFVQGLVTGDVVLVPEGTYYIVSNYGDTNAVVRSDIRVQVAKLTDVTVTHRAAVITLKLVGDRGGEALANTSWSVLTPGGDLIKESIGAFPRVVLAEGEYRAIARNEGKVFEREFKVINGVDGEIEVLAR
jgi:hypothetical protein